MFLKRCQRRKNGKTHAYWALVESYRTARGRGSGWWPTWANSRPASKAAGPNWAKLSRQAADASPAVAVRSAALRRAGDDEPVLVKLRGVRLERLATIWRRLDGPGIVAAAGAGRVCWSG